MITCSAQAALHGQNIGNARSGTTSRMPGWQFGGARTDSSGPPNCACVPVFAETRPVESWSDEEVPELLLGEDAKSREKNGARDS